MPRKTAEVIIVGAGIIGCSAAYYLAKQGVDTLVLEAGDIGGGASVTNGSGVRQNGRDLRELPLAMYGVQQIWPTLGEELGEDIEYQQSGNMRMGKTEEDERFLRGLVAQNVAAGLTEMRMLSREEVFELNPAAAPDVTCGFFNPSDGHANPMRTTLGFYIRARQLGARFVRGEKVLALAKHRGAIRRVITENDTYEAERVIVCANYPSRAILRSVGVNIPMLPAYTEAMVTEALPPIAAPFLGSATVSFYAQQQRNGTFVIGGEREYELYDADHQPPVTLSPTAPYIARVFLEYLPSLRGAKILRTWSGLLDMMVDLVPVISPIGEVPGLLAGCGFSAHGFGIGPAAGLSLAQMAIGQPPPVNLDALRYNRFFEAGRETGNPATP